MHLVVASCSTGWRVGGQRARWALLAGAVGGASGQLFYFDFRGTYSKNMNILFDVSTGSFNRVDGCPVEGPRQPVEQLATTKCTLLF